MQNDYDNAQMNLTRKARAQSDNLRRNLSSTMMIIEENRWREMQEEDRYFIGEKGKIIEILCELQDSKDAVT